MEISKSNMSFASLNSSGLRFGVSKPANFDPGMVSLSIVITTTITITYIDVPANFVAQDPSLSGASIRSSIRLIEYDMIYLLFAKLCMCIAKT